MFNYDDSVVADLLWKEYIELKQQNIDLQAKLFTAQQTVDTLQQMLAFEGTTADEQS
jgi:hypothetical protein